MTATSTVIYWNVEHGKHLDEACEWLASQRPDLVFWGELQPGDQGRVQDALGMAGYLAAHTPVSPNQNAIFLRPDGPFEFAVEHTAQHRRAPWHPKANLQVAIRDEHGNTGPGLLALVCEHSCYWSPTLRLIEAEWYSTVSKADGRVLAMGDWNSPPVGEEPDLARITDLQFLHNRTYLHPTLGRIPDTRPDETMAAAGYVDLARHTAARSSDHAPLTPTAGYRNPAQGGDRRIDRAYADPGTASAITSFDVVPGLEHLSDHRPIRAVFDLDRLRAVVNNTATGPQAAAA
ncbi:endonuclease/exonuclease/phosphatase family protein [Kitasatospora sp. NPDC048545]|uniref:endonuclease/exonuclease/phosphatase family protein n=1 Tax=Kitasatospora sp. NPDC048545 TaxID=3157208 RepID=UPI0033F79A6E